MQQFTCLWWIFIAHLELQKLYSFAIDKCAMVFVPPLAHDKKKKIEAFCQHHRAIYECVEHPSWLLQVNNNGWLYHRERILKSSTLSCNEEKEEITKPPTEWGRAPINLGALSEWGRAPIYEGAHPLFWVLSRTNKHPSTFQTSPLPPACNISWSPLHPYTWVRGGPHTPPPPFDLKSSIGTSWPRDGFLTTSQAVTMNPRSQWSLFEFGRLLNWEEICIQKFSCCSGERGHSVLVCLMGRL
jgi:hypothetical protein